MTREPDHALQSNSRDQNNSRDFGRGRFWPAAIAALVAAAISTTTAQSAEPVPELSLMDMNPTSDTHGQMVSPRDYVGKVSGWYFGHST